MVDQGSLGTEDPVRKKLLAEHGRLLARIEELEHEVSVTKRSRSWKITFPLRMVRPIIGFVRSLFVRTRHEILVDNRGMARSSAGRLPTGWAYVSFATATPAQSPLSLCFYFDEGEGIREYQKEIVRLNPHPVLIQFPSFLRELRIDALGAEPVPVIEVREVRSLATVLALARIQGLSFFSLLKLFSEGGAYRVWFSLLGRSLPQRLRDGWYASWVKRNDTVDESERLNFRKNWEGKGNLPLLSVLMPTYNTEERWLRRAIESVKNQTYPAWELCIADDASHRPSVRRVLEEYQASDSRIRVSFRAENGHISESSNTALGMASGQYVVLMDHDDELHPCALAEIGKVVIENPGLKIVFTDEDRLTEDHRRVDPYCKAGFDRELILTRNCISHLGVYRTDLARAIGGFRRGFEGSQDWDFALRAIEKVADNEVLHIPKVLYHWRMTPTAVSFSTDTKVDAFSAGTRAVEEHLTRTGNQGKIRSLSAGGFRIEYPEPQACDVAVVSLPLEGDIGSAKVVILASAGMIESGRERLLNLASPILAGRSDLVVGATSPESGQNSLASSGHAFTGYESLFDRGAMYALKAGRRVIGEAVAISDSTIPTWRDCLAGTDLKVALGEIENLASTQKLRVLQIPLYLEPLLSRRP